MESDQRHNCKHVFVCGLPRSGTSILGRNIARMDNCTGLHDTGVWEDEGRFLQNVYPTEGDCGGPGRFGFDPRAHLTETSPLLTRENAVKLRQSWERYWDQSKAIRVEKTPANLLMTRFLQAAFPKTYFVVIRRHPVAVSIATHKWKVSITSLHSLFEHWMHCHELFEKDKKYLNHVYELTYEDYIQNADKYHQEIAAFIGTRVPEPPERERFRYVAQWRNPGGLRVPEGTMEGTTGTYNKKYFDRWCHLLTSSPFKGYYRYIARKYESRFTLYGYSLREGFGLSEYVQEKISTGSDAMGALYCTGADVYAATWRGSMRCKRWLRLTSKAILPKFIITAIRQARQKRISAKPVEIGRDCPELVNR